jgi:hypothetical protein
MITRPGERNSTEAVAVVEKSFHCQLEVLQRWSYVLENL